MPFNYLFPNTVTLIFNSKFKVGDLIIGIPGNPYSITAEGVVCIVTSLFCFGEDNIRVKVVNKSDIPLDADINQRWPVEAKYFEIYKPITLKGNHVNIQSW